MNARMSLPTGILSLGLFVSQAVAITGGQVDEDNTYRNVGAMVFLGPSGPTPGEPLVVFSGTLIHPRVFLTAGHCTNLMLQSPHLPGFPSWHISFGTNAFDPSTWRGIEAVITHPNYQPPNAQGYGGCSPGTNDVGVIILREPIFDLPLAKLPRVGFLDELRAAGLLREPGECGTPFTVAGYGSTLDWPPPVSVPGDGWRRFAQSDYLALPQSWLYTLMNPATGNGGTGYSDSGGPNFWVEPDGTLVLVAVTSRGDPNCLAANIAWRVDTPETLEFISWVVSMVDAGLLP